MSTPAGGSSKYAVSSVAAQLGSAIDPVSRAHRASLTGVIPIRWNVVAPSHVDLRVMATGVSGIPAIRSHALARYVPPSFAPAASRAIPGPWHVAVRAVASALRAPECPCAVVEPSAAPPNPNQPVVSTSN